MPVKKIIKEEVEKVCGCRKSLIDFLQRSMPSMFDRSPVITGNLNSFVDEIINITCK